MRWSTFSGIHPSLLFLGFIASTTALAIADHPSSTDADSAQLVSRDVDFFWSQCNSWHLDKKTCILSGDCIKGNGRNKSGLNLNKCFYYHLDKDKKDGFDWKVDWNEKDQDRQG